MAKQPIRFLLYQTDANVGWRLRSNIAVPYKYEDEFDVVVQTNSLCLHDIKFAYQKYPNTPRLLFLGDSFTEGANVTIEHGFPYLTGQCLQQKTPVETINLGVAYYATTEELFLLQHEGVRYAPDVVVLMLMRRARHRINGLMRWAAILSAQMNNNNYKNSGLIGNHRVHMMGLGQPSCFCAAILNFITLRVILILSYVHG